MDRRALAAATGIGLILQLSMVVYGHDSEDIKSLFAFGGMAISLIAGVFFAGMAHPGWSQSLAGGGIAGAACALVGIAVSFALGDVPAIILVAGTFASLITGTVGGVIGKLAIK